MQITVKTGKVGSPLMNAVIKNVSVGKVHRSRPIGQWKEGLVPVWCIFSSKKYATDAKEFFVQVFTVTVSTRTVYERAFLWNSETLTNRTENFVPQISEDI